MLRFFVFEDIDLKLGTLMYYSFLINIVRNIFFSKVNIFLFINTLIKENLDLVIFLLIEIYFKNIVFKSFKKLIYILIYMCIMSF